MSALLVGAKPPAFSWTVPMLDLIERILKEIRTLRDGTEGLVLNGSVPDMERYRFLMGRLEALKLVEVAV
ncbi:MAG: hypothetical protein RL275_83, partial [Chloroflexota bacterium]